MSSSLPPMDRDSWSSSRNARPIRRSTYLSTGRLGYVRRNDASGLAALALRHHRPPRGQCEGGGLPGTRHSAGAGGGQHSLAYVLKHHRQPRSCRRKAQSGDPFVIAVARVRKCAVVTVGVASEKLNKRECLTSATHSASTAARL